jgi:hypothetical protein
MVGEDPTRANPSKGNVTVLQDGWTRSRRRVHLGCVSYGPVSLTDVTEKTKTTLKTIPTITTTSFLNQPEMGTALDTIINRRLEGNLSQL